MVRRRLKTSHQRIDNTGTAETNKADAKAQEDLIYACVSGNKTSNATGVDLTFKHALSEISVKATNSNTAYQIKVTGVKLGNINSQGTFKFADATTSATSDGTWNDLKTPVAYETDFTGDNAVTLDATEKNVDASTPFILIPQTCKKEKKAASPSIL